MENEISGFISDLKGPKDNGWYGVKLENDNVDRLYSGFKKPDGVVKGAKVSVAYILKEANGKTYYNITGLDVLSSAPADVEGYTPKVLVEQVTLSNPHVPAVSVVERAQIETVDNFIALKERYKAANGGVLEADDRLDVRTIYIQLSRR